jgi:isopentenyl-diphosphate delta-isomerase
MARIDTDPGFHYTHPVSEAAPSTDIQDRKDHHLALCRRDEVRYPGIHSLDRYRLEYDAAPELDLADVDLSVEVLGKRLRAPVLLGAMTGGSAEGGRINALLARVAERLGLGMCLGSQRAMLERPALAATYAVREAAPALPLLVGNLGAVQLRQGVDTAAVAGLFERAGLDALAFHLNPLQEAIQPEGDTTFAGLLERLHRVIPDLPGPCLIKEVGAGISRRTADKLAALPVAGVEASGVGGTSWARVESLRAPDGPAARAGERLAWLGVDTAASIGHCRRAFGDRLVIGSGGIETGHQTAVAIALGADAVALTAPLLRAASAGEAAVESLLTGLLHELRVLMFVTGARSIDALRQAVCERIPADEVLR